MNTPTEEQTVERVAPPWVRRLRDDGYEVRVGTGGPLEYEPAASFARHVPSLRERIGEWLIRAGEWVRGYSDDD